MATSAQDMTKKSKGPAKKEGAKKEKPKQGQKAKKKVVKEAAATLSLAEIESMVRKCDFSKTDTLKNAFQKELAFREATKKELTALIAQIKTLCEKSERADLEKVYKQLLEQFDLDFRLVEALNAALASNAKSLKDLTIPVRDNKLCVKGGVIEGGKKVLEKHFYDICAGKIDAEYNFDSNIVSVLGNEVGAKGNSKETHLKAALLAIHSHFSKQTIAQKEGGKWIDETPIASVHELPKELDLEKIVVTHQSQPVNFKSSSYYFSDERTPKGLTVPHSGYEFGAGHGPHARYPKGKLLSSLDCSSGVSSVLGYKHPVSTEDQCYYYQLKTQKLEASKSAWTKSPQCKLMEDSIPITNPAEVQIGDIYSYRKDAGGGHTAIVTQEVRPDGKLWTIGWNRNMPKLEGIGLQEFNCKQEGIKVSFLRQKKT